MVIKICMLMAAVLVATATYGAGTVRVTLDVRAKDGVSASSFQSSVYNDPRLRHATLMDYKKPGNIVIHLVPTMAMPGVAMQPEHTIRLRRKKRGLQLIPGFSAVPAGTAVRFVNVDRKPHILYSRAKQNYFKFYLGKKGLPNAEQIVTLESMEVVDIFALDVEGLEARVVVTGPFYKVLDEPGVLTFDDVPAGEYVVHAWHDRLPGDEVLIQVGSAWTNDISLVLDINKIPEIP